MSAPATGSGTAVPEPQQPQQPQQPQDLREPLAATLILLAPGDDVLVAARDLHAGVHRTSAGGTAVVREPVRLGHKVAARDLAKGEHVVRAGMSIGSTTSAVLAGEWVHTHNLASDYIDTFAHRGGER